MELKFNDATWVAGRVIDWNNYLEKHFAYCREAIDKACMRGHTLVTVPIYKVATKLDQFKDLVRSMNDGLLKAGYKVEWTNFNFKKANVSGALVLISWGHCEK